MQNTFFALDLSGLQQLTMLFTSLWQAFWPILVVLFVGSILLLILGVGARFGLGSIFQTIEVKQRIPSKKGIFKLAIGFSFLLLLLIPTMGVSGSVATVEAVGADGAIGSLEVGVTSILEKTPVTIHMFDLTPGADYKVNWTGDATGHTFTTGSQQDEHFITINIDKPAASHDVTVYLIGAAAGNDSNAIDSLTLYVSDTSLFPDDIIIDIGITVAVIFVIVAAVLTLKNIGKRG